MKPRGKRRRGDEMNEALALYAAGHDDADDQPLTKAARVALEANPTPRFIKMKTDQDGAPIEIPEDVLPTQIELPI